MGQHQEQLNQRCKASKRKRMNGGKEREKGKITVGGNASEGELRYCVCVVRLFVRLALCGSQLGVRQTRTKGMLV